MLAPCRHHPGLFAPLLGGADRNKILEQSGRNTPVIGFTVCYGAANVLLAEGHCSLR
jgi:putative transport protein